MQAAQKWREVWPLIEQQTLHGTLPEMHDIMVRKAEEDLKLRNLS